MLVATLHAMTRPAAVVMLSLAVLASSRTHAQPASVGPPAEERLLQQIHLAESLYRDDLMADAIERLFRIKPDHPSAIGAQLRLALLREDIDAARQALRRLEIAAPDSEAYRAASVLWRLKTIPEQAELLGHARLFAAAGRHDEARELYDRIFAGVYPTADYLLEYWEFRASKREDRPLALSNLKAGLLIYPEHAGLLSAAARFALAEKQDVDALELIHRLSRLESGRATAARMEFDYLSSKPVNDATAAAWRAFAERYAGLPLAAQATEQAIQQKALLDDPAWRAGRDGIALIRAKQDTPRALVHLQRAARAYPADPEVLGALGLAYLRSRQRREALKYFQLAQANEAVVGSSSAWVSLIETTRYWLALEEGDRAISQQRWDDADRQFALAQRLMPAESHAYVKRGGLAFQRGRDEEALAYYRQALAKAPREAAALRGIQRVLERMPVDAAAMRLDQLGIRDPATLARLHRMIELRAHMQRGREAQDSGDWHRAVYEWGAAQALDLDDPWISYQLARSIQHQAPGSDAAMQAYERHLAKHPRGVSSRYAQALLLSSEGKLREAIGALEHIDAGLWTDEMNSLARRTRAQIQIERLRALEPGQTVDLRAALEQLSPSLPLLGGAEARKAAELWLSLGERDRARQVLEEALARAPKGDAVIHRDLARLSLAGDPELALRHYASAMQQAGMVGASSEDAVPLGELSAATRMEHEDGWLERSLRRETAALYQIRNPALKLHDDYWFRNDGTPGVSRLKANTAIARFELPMAAGRAFVQADHVRMDAGTFETASGGAHTNWFGTCRFGTGRRTLPGCSSDLEQRASGTGLSVGYEGERFSMDLGRSPYGFEVGNWLGGISYRGKWEQLGWRLTLSRRPVSSSLLSYAGARDPRTGIAWGGVVATGPSLGLSWDQGGAYGIWADLSHHRLTGQNVEDNSRTRLMAGYYRRLINESDRTLTAGITAMYWRYQKNLGEYSLGHGGYYSPQRYTSLSLPVRYAYRGHNWTFLAEASVSTSWARFDEGNYYPIPGLISAPLADLGKQGVAGADVLQASRIPASSSRGTGYAVRVAGERRLNDHWVLGGSFEIQKSQDYSPNRAMLYLRYTFKPWRGDLPLSPEPIRTYADFR